MPDPQRATSTLARPKAALRRPEPPAEAVVAQAISPGAVVVAALLAAGGLYVQTFRDLIEV